MFGKKDSTTEAQRKEKIKKFEAALVVKLVDSYYAKKIIKGMPY